MSGLNLVFTLAAAAYAFGKYFFSEDDTPPPDSYHASSSYNSGTTQTQTQQSYGPPPSPLSPPYTYQPPAKNAYSQTTVRTPALSDHSRGIRYPSLPYTGTPSQSQLSSSAHDQTTVRTPALSDHSSGIRYPSLPYTGTPTKTSAPHDYDRCVYHSSVSSPYSRTPGQTQLSSTELPEYEDEDDYIYQDEDEDEYRYEGEDEYEYEYEDQNGDEYEYQTTSHVPSRVHTVGNPHLPIAPVGGVSSHTLSDELDDVSDLELTKKLRRRKDREMSEAHRRAKSAAQRQGALSQSKMNKRVAKIFKKNNKNHREGRMIDLHGLRVAEAIQVAKDELETARSRGDEVVRFIVGKGLHSDAGGAKIRPALQDLFTQGGLIHWLDPSNAGVLVVQLD
ncbi:hypothetical protein EDB92DRAFT_1905837 [Lactarius akahatsu]|uniref:Smr domain-containing protein n=1 Tax=Lactarius akahatsu TaxID=416441 RepID=A0AAD4L875_9AGAM|nr:hypothetical protein EDB92DRAFT_1905837 [Lactarius akahatsu]